MVFKTFPSCSTSNIPKIQHTAFCLKLFFSNLLLLEKTKKNMMMLLLFFLFRTVEMVIGIICKIIFCAWLLKMSLRSYYTFTYTQEQFIYCWFVAILHTSRLGYLNIVKSNKYERIPGSKKLIALNLLRSPNLHTNPVIPLILTIAAATGDKQYTINEVQRKRKMTVLENKWQKHLNL